MKLTGNRSSGRNTLTQTIRGRRKLMLFSAATTAAAGLVLPITNARAATDAWSTSPTDSYFADTNWTTGTTTPGAATGMAASGDSLYFGTSSLTTLNNNDSGFTFAGLTFNSGANAFVIGGSSITLSGGITDNATSTETINFNQALSATQIMTVASGGQLILGGNISGSGFGITTAGAGTLTLSGVDTYTGTTTVANGTTLNFGTSGVLGSNAGSLTNVTMGTGGLTDVIDLAGTSQTLGTLTSVGTTSYGYGGIITSSVAGGALTLNEGGTNANAYGGTLFTGSLALKVVGNTTGNVQMTNASSSFSGGLTISSSGASSVGVASLTVGGGLTGQNSEGIRFSANSGSLTSPIGTGTVTLDNGQLFGIGGATSIANNIVVTARGGIIHNENAGASYTGSLSSTANTMLVLNSNSGNSHGWTFSGNNSGFTGTMAIDTTNIGSVAFGGSATGSSNLDLLWYGDGANGGLGVVESALTGTSGTLTFGELNNLNSGTIGSTFSGAIENTGSLTTTTIALGDSNSAAATFQGVIKNNVGTIALYKGGTNTQILSGTHTYTGTTTVSGGVLDITGSLASGTTATVNNGGTLIANAGTNAGGIIAGPVNVNGGGAVGGTGTLSGLLTLSTGTNSTSQGAINLTSNSTGTLNITNAAGLTLGGSSGNAAAIDVNAGNRVAVTGALTVNAGGASIYITPGTAVANSSYTLMTFASGTGSGFTTGSGTTVGSFVLADPTLSFGVSGVLNVASGTVTLTTTGAAAPATAYWSGAQGTAWTAVNSSGTANFTTDQAGSFSVAALPGNTTSVIFAGNGATNLTTSVLGQAFDIGSLTFLSGTGTVTIGGSNSLQIEAGGITDNDASAVSINTGSLVLGSTQSWTNNTSTPLAITSIVSGSGGLTIAGPVNLGGSSFASGSLTVNGALDVKGTSITTGNFSGSGSITNTGTSNATLNVTISSPQTYSGTLADGGAGKTLSLFKGGSNTLTLTGSNTYTGTTMVSGGTLQLGSPSALGTSTVTIDSSTTLDLDGQTITNPLTIAGSGVGGAGALVNSSTLSTAAVNADMLSSPSFTVGGPGNITLQRVQSGTVFTLTDNSTGTLTLGTSSTSNHDNLLSLVVNDGTVLLNMPANFIAVDRGMTVNPGAYVRITGTSNEEFSAGNAIALNGGTFDLNNNSISVGALSGNGTLTNTNASSATATYTNAGNVTASFSGAITDNAGAGGGMIAYTQSGSLTVETLSGSNSYVGLTTVSNGTLIAASNAALGSGTATTAGLSLTGSTAVAAFTSSNPAIASLGSTQSGASVVLGNVSGNSSTTLTIGGNNNSTSFAGVISDGSATSAGAIGSITKVGTGTLTLSNSNTYTGGTLIRAGTILATAGNALGTGTITLGDGSSNSATLIGNPSSANVTNPNAIVVAAGTGTYTIKEISGHDYSFSGPITLNSPVTLETTANGASFYSGLITGSSTITIDGGGSTSKFVEFNNAGNAAAFSGNLVIQDSGSFKTNTGGIGSLTTVYMDSGSTVFDNGVTNVTVAGFDDVTGAPSSADIIDAGSGYLLTLAGSGTYSFSGAITNSGGVTKTGTGQQTLNGNSSYSGGTAVSEGTLAGTVAGAFGTGSVSVSPTGTTLGASASLVVGADNAIASTAAVTVNNNASAVGTIYFNDPVPTIASLSGTGNVVLATGTALTTGNSGSSTFSGVISDGGSANSGSLTATGSGTITLAGSSTYFGSTNVNGGTLNITGALTNSGTVNLTGSSNLVLTAASALPPAAIVNVGANANALVNASQTIAAISSSGNATFSAGTSIVGTGSGIGTGAGGGSTSGGISGSGTLTVNGTANLYAAKITQSVLNIGTTNTVTIADSAAPGNASSVSVLTDINNSGTLDLNNNDLIVTDSVQYSTIKALINTAADGGAWDQPGITSSSARANSSAYGLGYAPASSIGTSVFDGVTLAGTETIVKYTLLGDTQLRGAVGIGDYDTVLSNYGTGTDWSQGNFHYAGVVGIGDYDDVLSNYGAHPSGNLVVNPALTHSVNPALSLSPAAAKSDLKLEVNTTTGDVYLEANTSVAFTGYTISDPSAHLLGGSTSPDPAKLLSVSPGNGGNTNAYETGTTYINWFKISETSIQMSEGQNNNGFANHSSRDDTINIPAGGTIDFGDIYNTAVNNQDISFDFAEAGTTPTNGPAYYGAEVDYVGGVATPEPATLGVLGLGGVMMMRRRRRTKA